MVEYSSSGDWARLHEAGGTTNMKRCDSGEIQAKKFTAE
jgi:hypothetical protein